MAPPTKIVKLGETDKPRSNLSEAQHQELVEKIDEIQSEIDKLDEKASDEILKVEQKYVKLRQPYFKKRSDLIEKLPCFWATTFINHPKLSELISLEDEEVFQYLTKVDVQEFDDIKSGFSISFHFKENEFIKNSVLVKEFHLDEAGEPSSKSTPIQWKSGKDFTKSKAAGGDRPLGTESHESFFSWFADNGHFVDEIGEIIKDDIWAFPVPYFMTPDMYEDGNEEEDEENIDEDEDEEEDDA